MINLPDSVRPGDPDAPWNQPEPEWEWFTVQATIDVHAQGVDHVRELLDEMESVGTRRFKSGQERTCVQLDYHPREIRSVE